jgi:hypothetical protein
MFLTVFLTIFLMAILSDTQSFVHLRWRIGIAIRIFYQGVLKTVAAAAAALMLLCFRAEIHLRLSACAGCDGFVRCGVVDLASCDLCELRYRYVHEEFIHHLHVRITPGTDSGSIQVQKQSRRYQQPSLE